MDQLDARVSAARQALEVASGSGHHGIVSKTQAAAIRQAISDALQILTPDTTAALVLTLSGLKWELHAHFQFATGPLQTASDCVGRKRRRNVQDWLALPSYFTQSMWNMLGDETRGASEKLDIMLNFAFRGGLRLPSEQTSKMITSIYLIMTQPKDMIGLLSVDQKMVYLKHVKAMLSACKKRAGEPLEFLEHLPNSPCSLQSSHPTIFNAWSGT